MSEDVKPYGTELPSTPEQDATELRKMIDHLGMSQRAAAAELDVSERTMRVYCRGEDNVPRVVMLAMRWLLEHRPPSTSRYLQVHWRHTGHTVKRGDKFEMTETDGYMSFSVNGATLFEGSLADLAYRGLVSIHLTPATDRFEISAKIVKREGLDPTGRALPSKPQAIG